MYPAVPLVSSGGGGEVQPAFGPTGQIGVLLGLILALVVLSYIFSTVGYKRLGSK